MAECRPRKKKNRSKLGLEKFLKSEGFEILAINLDESSKQAEHFSKKFELPFPVLLDPDGKMARQYLVYGLPYTVLVDREGKIREKIFGEQLWHAGEAFQKILVLIKGKNDT